MAQEPLNWPDSPPVEDMRSLGIQSVEGSQFVEDTQFVEGTRFVEDTNTWPGLQWFALQGEDSHKEDYPWVAWGSPQAGPLDA